MLLRWIYRLLAFDRRRELLEQERRFAENTERVWDGLLPTRSTASQHTMPPRVYAQPRGFMSPGSQGRNEGRAGPTGDLHQPKGSMRGIAEKILKKCMPPEAEQLFNDALEYGEERRAYGRESFVHPIILEIEHDGSRHSAFIRDVSIGGVGLLHFVQLEPQRITVQTRRYNDQVLRVEIDIAWCVPCGAGYFMSGGTFVTPWTE